MKKVTLEDKNLAPAAAGCCWRGGWLLRQQQPPAASSHVKFLSSRVTSFYDQQF
jgi:hypothetical protein